MAPLEKPFSGMAVKQLYGRGFFLPVFAFVAMLAVSCSNPQASLRPREVGYEGMASTRTEPNTRHVGPSHTESDVFSCAYFTATCGSLRMRANGVVALVVKLTASATGQDMLISFCEPGVRPGTFYNEPGKRDVLDALRVQLQPNDGSEFALVSYAGLKGPPEPLDPRPLPNLTRGQPLCITFQFVRVGRGETPSDLAEPLMVTLPVLIHTRKSTEDKWAKAGTVDVQVVGIRNQPHTDQ